MEKDNKKLAPDYLMHKPIITVDYEEKDGDSGDASFMTIGKATWNEAGEDYSAKIWRYDYKNEKWSRASQELPFWRVLDLATLLVSVINDKESPLGEFLQTNENEKKELQEFIKDNMYLLAPRLSALKKAFDNNSHDAGVQNKDSLETCPNVFSFATSELSQDALIAWLISWADIKYKDVDPSLHKVAQDFVKLLLKQDSFTISKMEVGRQWKNIDIWAEINDDTFLVIEDKTNTTIHDDQLAKYKEIVENEYNGLRNNQFFIYLKTGNEPLSVLTEVEKKGYYTIDRSAILNCIKEYNGNNTILINYIEHLNGIESKTNSFRHLPVSEWDYYAWQGFYKELEQTLRIDKWGYVANPSGGFLGAWWYFKGIPEGELYLQFEEKKLCFKLCCENSQNKSVIRNKWSSILLNAATLKGYTEIKRPNRFGAGYYMTIAVVDEDYLFTNNLYNSSDLVTKLVKYQNLIDEVIKADQ